MVDDLQKLDPANAQQYKEMIPTFNAYYEVGQKMAKAYIEQGPAGGNTMMLQFDEVAAAMAETVDAFLEDSEIRASTVVAEEMSQNVTRISDVSNQSAEGAQTVSAASHRITELSEALKTLVGQFRF